MLLFAAIFSIIIYSVQGKGEFLIGCSPSSIVFQGNKPIDQDLIPDVLATTFGFTSQKESDWSGMTVLDPFNYAEAVFVLVVDGISSLGNRENIVSFPIKSTDDETETWLDLKTRILERFPTQNNTVYRMEAGDSAEYKGEEDAFVQQLEEVEQLGRRVSNTKPDGIPDLYWVLMNGLHAVSDAEDETTTQQAKELTLDTLSGVCKLLKKTYRDKVLVAALVTDSSHTRRSRALLQDQPQSNQSLRVDTPSEKAKEPGDDNYNLATDYKDSYAAMFNIMLWFAIIFILSLIAISVFIADMDPGRDSIIYRMTSNRMKKDS